MEAPPTLDPARADPVANYDMVDDMIAAMEAVSLAVKAAQKGLTVPH